MTLMGYLSSPYKPFNTIHLINPFTVFNDGPKAVQCSHIYTPYSHTVSNQYPTPTPPLRNLFLADTPHGVLDTGPLPPLGNNWIKAGLTGYSNSFLGRSCVKVGYAGVGCVIWGGRGE